MGASLSKIAYPLMGNSFSSDVVPGVFEINDLKQFPYPHGFRLTKKRLIVNRTIERCFACAVLKKTCSHDLIDDATYHEFLNLVCAIKHGDRSLHVLFHVTVLAVRCVQMGMIIPGSFIRLPCSTFGRDWVSWWEKNYPSQFPSCLARMLNVFFCDLEWIRGLAPRRASVIFLGLCKNRTLKMGGYPLPREISLNIAGMVLQGWSGSKKSPFSPFYLSSFDYTTLLEEVVRRASQNK